MKRIGNVWDKIVEVADEDVRDSMRDETYGFHKFLHITVHDRKKRFIDYACEHDAKLLKAVHKVLAPLLTKKIIPVSYSSMKGRGQLRCSQRVRRLVRKYRDGYHVVIDIKKYYPSIDHELLREELLYYIKDRRLLRFFDRLIANHKKGLPVGLAVSALLANLYLNKMLRHIQEVEGVQMVVYMDDLLFFFQTKTEAQAFIPRLMEMLKERRLVPHDGIHAIPVRSGVWYIGYVTYTSHVLLRKNIRDRMKRRHRMLEKQQVDDATYKRKMAPYFGWCIHADCLHLMKKTMGERYKLFEENVMKYKRLQDKKAAKNWFGLPKESRESIRDLVGKELVIFESLEVEVYKERKAAVRYCYPDHEEEMHYFLTRSDVVMDRLQKDKEEWPALVSIVEKKGKNGRNYFCYE